jgi:hypothetical protein
MDQLVAEIDEEQDQSQYRPTGCAQALVQSARFQELTAAVIIVNVIWLAIDTDFNKAELLCDAPPLFIVVNNIFCSFFFFEVVLRFWASRSTWATLTDFHFLFDAFLVATMAWETWIEVALYLYTGWPQSGSTKGSSVLRVFRIFRVSRVARLGRLLRIIPELLVLIKGMMIAMRSVFATLLLLVLAIYVFAIIFTSLLSQTALGDEAFGGVLTSMHFLLVQVICGFDADFVTKMLGEGIFYYLLYLSYIFFASLTIMNMLIGVICQVVGEVADVESEAVVMKGLQKTLEVMMQHIDAEGNMPPKMFAELITDASVTGCLIDLGVDINALINEVCLVYRDREKMEKQLLQDIVLGFRRCSSKNVTMKDIMGIRTFVSDELAALEARLCRDMHIGIVENEATKIHIDSIRTVEKKLSRSTSSENISKSMPLSSVEKRLSRPPSLDTACRSAPLSEG